MSAPRQTVTTIGQFTEWVEEVGYLFTRKPNGQEEPEYLAPWFRGAGKASYHLRPGLYRSPAGREKFADDELRSEFMRKGIPLIADRPPRNAWEWYFVMQHYRAPTRLLDWSDSAFVALYFAITSWTPPKEEGRKTESLPVVWALNPYTLNASVRKEWGPLGPDWEGAEDYLPEVFSEKALPKFPIAIDPSFTDQRMLVQHSHFTIHGSDTRGIDEMRDEVGLKQDLFPVVVNVETYGIDFFWWQLRLLGITETGIFPDLEGLSRELRLEYGIDRSRPIS